MKLSVDAVLESTSAVANDQIWGENEELRMSSEGHSST